MRPSLMVLAFVVGFGTPAVAQSALDGPLASPDAPAPAPAHHPAAKPKRVRHAAGKAGAKADPPATPDAAATAETPAPHRAAADDPVSLGMKWNGSNDTAAQTRWQNLNGGAPGTGAEVGLKLHF